jgi:hypothetical protein
MERAERSRCRCKAIGCEEVESTARGGGHLRA